MDIILIYTLGDKSGSFSIQILTGQLQFYSQLAIFLYPQQFESYWIVFIVS